MTMRYGLRMPNGQVLPVTEGRPLTEDQVEAAVGGGAELVYIDARGVATAVDLRPPRGISPSPLWSITILYSESRAFHVGNRFDSIAEFDASVRVARAKGNCTGQRIALAISWTDGTTVHTRFDLSLHGDGCLVENLYRICITGAHGVTTEKARRMFDNVFAAAVAEQLNSKDWYS